MAEDSGSDREQEGQRWLKPLHKKAQGRGAGGGGRVGGGEGGKKMVKGMRGVPLLRVSEPTPVRGGEREKGGGFDYSKDSLEVTADSETPNHAQTTVTATSSEKGTGDFEDTFSLTTEGAGGLDQSGRFSLLSQSGRYSTLGHSSHHSTLMGADTLEENLEKEQVFAALEAGRSSPVDYSELNRNLGDTGLTTLSTGSLASAQPPAVEMKEARGDDARTESGHSGSDTETETECNKKHNERDIPSNKSQSVGHLSPAHLSTDLRAPSASASPVSAEDGHHSPLSTRLSPELLPSRAMASPHTHSQGGGRGGDLHASSRSLKSDHYSSSFESSGSLSEGRGFTLSPIHSGSVVAAQVKELVADHSSSSSLSPSPSPSPELERLTHQNLPGQMEGKRSGMKEASKTKGHGVKSGAAEGDGESAVSLHMPAVELKGQLTSDSRSEIKSSSEPVRRGGGDGEQSSTHIHLPLTQPRAGDMPHSDPSPQRAAHPKPQRGGPQEALREEDEHLPGPVASAAQVPAPTELQGRGEGGQGDRGEVVPRESTWMREVGKDLERELGELQRALKAAGLPKLGEAESSDSDDTLKNRSPVSPASVSPEHALSQPRPSHQPCPPQRQEGKERTMPSVGSKQSGSSGGGLESTIRALAAEELTSITKELLLQDLESEGTGRGEEGRVSGLKAGGVAVRTKAAEHKKTAVRIPAAVGGVSGERGRDGSRPGGRESQAERGVRKSSHSPAAQALKQTFTKDTQRSIPPSTKSSTSLPSHPAAKRRGSLTTTNSRAQRPPPKASSAPHTKPGQVPGGGRGRGRKTLPSTAGALAGKDGGRRRATAVGRGEVVTLPPQRTQGSVRAEKASGEEEEKDLVKGSHVERESEREGGESVGGGEELEVLRSEVEKWKRSWTEEKAHTQSLHSQLSALEERQREREEAAKRELSQKEEEHKEALSSLNMKLQEYEASRTVRHRLAVGGAISQQEKEELQSSIKEQETLLQGYQKENEKLYSQLGQAQQEVRVMREQLQQENQRLQTELLNTKSQLERRLAHVAPPSTGDQAPPTPGGQATPPSHARIVQLELKLEQSQDQCRELERQVKQLKHSVHCLEKEAQSLRHSKEQLEQRASTAPSQERELKSLQEKHKSEVQSLNRKLQWYVENQRLLDSDLTLLREKDKEIATLKEELAVVQRTQTSKQKLTKSRAADARRVQQLESQVKDLQNIIQKRFPNSLSALILASGGAARDGVSGGGVASVKVAPPTPSSSQLERRVRELEEEVERRQEEERKRIRALQQKYSAMEVLYEQQLSSLREQLENQPGNGGGGGGGSAWVSNEREVGKVERVGGEEEASWLQAQVLQLRREKERLQSQLREQVTSREAERQQTTSEEMARENEALRQQLSRLQLDHAHERVQLQGQLAQAEASARAAAEEAAAKLSSLSEEHAAKVDSLVAQFARQHSQSEVAKLRSKVSVSQATISHLRDQLQCSRLEGELLASSKQREELLSQQVKQLSEQLVEAKRHHTPEMHHFSSLLAKISSLELRVSEYESRMREQALRLRQPTDEQLKAVEHKWMCLVKAKNEEIEQFRQELDTILSTLHALQTPVSPSNH